MYRIVNLAYVAVVRLQHYILYFGNDTVQFSEDSINDADITQSYSIRKQMH